MRQRWCSSGRSTRASNLVMLWRSFTRWAGVLSCTSNAATPIALTRSCAASTRWFPNNPACAPATARPWLILPKALRAQHDELSEAEEELVRGIELARRGDAKFELVYGLTAYARLKAAQGDRRRGEELLQKGRAELDACVDPGILTQLVADAEPSCPSKPGLRHLGRTQMS
jgi:hypothetical protein